MAARTEVEKSVSERYRNFGPRKAPPPPDPEPPSIFAPGKSVAGETGTDVNGDPIVQLNKYCYQELERNVPTARDYGHSIPMPHVMKCMFNAGGGGPRGDLFDHLKKEDRPLPEPKPGTDLSTLPERIETAAPK